MRQTKNNKKNLFLFIAMLAFGSSLLVGCVTPSNRTKAPIADDPKNIRPLPFEARNSGANQFKPRVLVLMAKVDSVVVPREWSQKAETELMHQLNLAGSYVLLHPSEVDLNTKDLIEQGKWDWEKIYKLAREKSIPMVMEWELKPIQIQQESDPVGMMRERQRRIVVQVKARMAETRKGKDLIDEIGQAQREDKDVLWLSKGEKKITVADYDHETLNFLLKESITTLVPSLVAQASRVSWSGRVAMIKNDRLYLNVGRQSGLQVGDILKVLDTSDEVFDPETGESIGKVPGSMKGTLEVVNYFGSDGAIAVVHSGAGFQENDSIVLY